MLWFKKGRYEKALKLNKLIHDAIVMGVADKYIEEDNLENDDFGLQLLGRALNWAIPDLNYDFEKDLEKVEDREIKERLAKEEDRIFEKGLHILNSDSMVGDLITHYIVYEVYLANTLFNKEKRRQFNGLTRMRKFLFQNLDPEPDVTSIDFAKNYKDLFIKFNDKYGAYDKFIKKDTIDKLFSSVK